MITEMAAVAYVRETTELQIKQLKEKQEHCINLLHEVIDPKHNEEILNQMGFK